MKHIKLFENFEKRRNSFLFESIDSELEKIREFGYQEIERYETEPYTLILLHNTEENIYELSVTTDEQDFTTFEFSQ